MKIHALDHLVLTVRDIRQTCTFYRDILGMTIRTTAHDRKAIHFGSSKINLHQLGAEFLPHAQVPTPGSADLCFLTETPIDQVISRLRKHGVDLIEGPVERTGATGKLLSIYFRDPDGNLLEVANLLPSSSTTSYNGTNHAA